MRFIKLGILSIIFLFLLITVISLFIPSHIRISKAINFRAGNSAIMEQIKDPLQWKNWYPGLDSAKPFYTERVLKGMIMDEAGKASLVIREEKQDEITAEFLTPTMRPVINVWKTISYPGGDSTTLQWYMDFHLRWYPWEKFGSLILEKSYGSKMEQGLTNLKKFVEDNHTSNN